MCKHKFLPFLFTNVVLYEYNIYAREGKVEIKPYTNLCNQHGQSKISKVNFPFIVEEARAQPWNVYELK